MLIKNSKSRPNYDHPENDVISEGLYQNRRQFLKGLALSAVAPSLVRAETDPFSTVEKLTSEYSVTHYNNFYEFSLSKEGPAKLAKDFQPLPWQVAIEGEVEKPITLGFEDVLKKTQQRERIYRLRCVEAWSMVIPWRGFELRELLSLARPTSKAKFVQFETLYDPERMPGQRRGALGFFSLDWPYVEGLRIDEAMHPLTILATGVFDKSLPNQNGAPLRLVVPWKYGFKSIKSIVKIKLVEKMPVNTWQQSAPSEYGFYANVNPKVNHPRWSQAQERRIIDESFFGTKRIETEMFNGYGEHVAELYRGLDLSRWY
ncbi:protein-methionine-sulfoxide reductase catalytic subunit MsrP [Pleionea litopenaei]|uniref:Protein-methionine-sulfoxide reductase catalytic subunit MsrP n=1 Tax=Pleionea litopenaei TaxID=3070815 RepID=A0AA51RVK2_9GAMM|nr:protein-methionine-sulfoxide reductase catalytic subunit MsrP [Pleionea sp. HL-JVS1]WMS88365.1 protein-methionine-sulfoxide reductase catalytic subunit MsrP [Pleionea sp. HL-JVS1]